MGRGYYRVYFFAEVVVKSNTVGAPPVKKSFVTDRKSLSRHALLSFVFLNLAMVFFFYGRLVSFTQALFNSVYYGLFICMVRVSVIFVKYAFSLTVRMLSLSSSLISYSM